MSERGAALVEALIVIATAGLVWAAAVAVIADLPPLASAWEEAAATRQRARVLESRVARVAAAAAPIGVDVDGARVQVPSVWPRRLGLFRPGAAGEVAADAVTMISRVDALRAVTLASALAAGGGSVAFATQSGCGSAADCRLRPGDLLLAITRDGACGLFRLTAVTARLEVDAIVQAAAPVFEPGSVLLPVAISVFSFDADERAIRRYDGYRSDNVLVDGIASAAFAVSPHAAATLGDGPLVGTGPLAYDLDQLSIQTVSLRVTFTSERNRASAPGAMLEWRVAPWR